MTEIPGALEIIKKEQEIAAIELINGIANLQDSLAYVVEKIPGIDAGSKASLEYTSASLCSFVDSNPTFKTASPRSIREDDRKKILPGQHGGVYLQFDLEDGTVLKVNFWGGLRTMSAQDLKDRDISLRFSHTSRTEEVLTQNTEVNWQIIFRNGPTVDSWMHYNPGRGGSFQQDALRVGGEGVDCHPSILNDNPMFNKLKEGVLNPINDLVKLVPSSV